MSLLFRPSLSTGEVVLTLGWRLISGLWVYVNPTYSCYQSQLSNGEQFRTDYLCVVLLEVDAEVEGRRHIKPLPKHSQAPTVLGSPPPNFSDLWTSVAPYVSSLVEPTYNSAVSQELMLPRQLEPPFRKLTFPLNLTPVTGPNYLAGNGLYLVRLCSDCDT